MTIKRILGTCVVTLVALTSAAGVWLGGAGEALAPEPARLAADLSGANTTATAVAVYVNTNTPTKVIKWFGTFAKPANVHAGQPCYPGNLAAPNRTYKVIRVTGSSATCL